MLSCMHDERRSKFMRAPLDGFDDSATFMKFGRAPTTLITFSIDEPEVWKLDVEVSGDFKTWKLKPDDESVGACARLFGECVSRVHHQLRQPRHSSVVHSV